MNIVISALTAAGKTTHALLLARRFGYDYVSASQLMLGLLGMDIDESNTLWATRMALVEKRRDDRPIDQELNDYLALRLRQGDRTVFDTWSGPWLYQGPHCLRVWIESDLRSRTMKARVSQYPHGPALSLQACRRLIDQKDETTAARLRPLLGVDIRHDRRPFDLVLDNSALIEKPSIESARRGIHHFHDRLTHAVSSRLLANSAASLR